MTNYDYTLFPILKLMTEAAEFYFLGTKEYIHVYIFFFYLYSKKKKRKINF